MGALQYRVEACFSRERPEEQQQVPPRRRRRSFSQQHLLMARIPAQMALEDLEKILPHIVNEGLPDGGEFLTADLNTDERTPQLIALLIWHGFLPMALMGNLLPKIHKARCVMPPREVHVGRRLPRKAKGYRLTIDTAWDLVVDNIQRLTFTNQPGDCWLTDDLARAYLAVGSVDAQWRRGGVAFHSVELWHTKSGELVAGEIGYTCGSVYSSCTGFTRKEQFPGAGTVQLAALGCWLERCGFALWDLGMGMDYKFELGGKLVPRAEWALHVRNLRSVEVVLAQPADDDAAADRLIAGIIAGRVAATSASSDTTGTAII